jgi:hypothetical protein
MKEIRKMVERVKRNERNELGSAECESVVDALCIGGASVGADGFVENLILGYVQYTISANF